MDLKNFTKHLIYQSANTQIPDNFSRFQILHPEYSAHESVVKTYPLPENEHLFSLLWDIHDGLSTVIIDQAAFENNIFLIRCQFSHTQGKWL